MDDAANEAPEDFVIATGVQYSIRQFVIWAASELGIGLNFEGSGESEIAGVRLFQAISLQRSVLVMLYAKLILDILGQRGRNTFR